MIRQSKSIAGLLCVAVTVILHLNTLDCGFCYDDKKAILENMDLLPNTSWSNILRNDFWGTPLHLNTSHKSYRPLCVATFKLNYLLHELEPMGYHLVNILLHGVVCYLYVQLVSLVLSEVWPALIAGLLFAVHPIHTEAVAGLVGRAELLAALFFVSAILFYHKAAISQQAGGCLLMASLLLTLAALLCKETGLTVMAVALSYDFFLLQKNSLTTLMILVRRSCSSQPLRLWPFLTRVLLVVVFTVGLLGVRLWLNGAPPSFHHKDNEALSLEYPYRQLHWAYMTFVNSELLLNPSRLMHDYRMGAIPLITSLTDRRHFLTILTLSAYIGLGFFAVGTTSHREHSPNNTRLSIRLANGVATRNELSKKAHVERYSSQQVVLFGMSLLVFPYLPASNLFFPVGFVVAERVLYLPSMGLCLLVAHGVWKLLKHSPLPLTKLFLVALLITHSMKTITRNRDWYSKITVYNSLLQLHPDNGYILANLAKEYREMGQFEKAEAAYRRGMSVSPELSINYVNLGAMLKKLQRYTQAEQVMSAGAAMLNRTLHKDPANLEKLTSLLTSLSAVVGRDPGRLYRALYIIDEALRLNHKRSTAHNMRGTLLLRMGELKLAREAFTTALTFDLNNTDAQYNLALVYKQQGEVTKSVTMLEALLKVDGSHHLARTALNKLITFS